MGESFSSEICSSKSEAAINAAKLAYQHYHPEYDNSDDDVYLDAEEHHD
jgi:hypothetical protein